MSQQINQEVQTKLWVNIFHHEESYIYKQLTVKKQIPWNIFLSGKFRKVGNISWRNTSVFKVYVKWTAMDMEEIK
jgi:hypothetical protein